MIRKNTHLHTFRNIPKSTITTIDLRSKDEYRLDPSLIVFIHEHPEFTNEQQFRDTIENTFPEQEDDFYIWVRDHLYAQKSDNQKQRTWYENGWKSAYIYHTYTQDYPFYDYTKGETLITDLHLMKTYREDKEPPALFKRYPNAPTIALSEATSSTIPFKKALSANSENHEIDLQSVSEILRTALGYTGIMKLPGVGESLVKTSPSGGARHPTEGYFINIEVEGIEPGVYHYNVEEHALDFIKNAGKEQILDVFYQANHRPGYRCQAIIALSSRFIRNMWRYREPRTFRVIFLDLGHVLQTINLLCDAKGMARMSGHGFEDSQADKMLNLNTSKESCLYYVALLKKEDKKLCEEYRSLTPQ